MRPLDVAVLCLYLVGTVLFSTYFSRSQHNIRDYFGSGATFGIAWLVSLLVVESQHAEPDRPDSETSW